LQAGHRWFAATYDLCTRQLERRVLGELRPFVVGEARGRVLEIGAGTGASFPYYDRGAVEKLVVTEPDPFMLRRARKRVAELGLEVELHSDPAEALHFADASFDTAITTLVLCTVRDPDRSLAEIKRVLRPGGDLRFIEHVRAEGWVGALQDRIVPLWRWLGAGCHPNRRTLDSIAASFTIERLERRLVLGSVPIIAGVARLE
jgi:ubiquinone/menaquinone biosynthesis C-methylase UbiE